MSAGNSGITNKLSLSAWVKATTAVIGGTTSVAGAYNASAGSSGFGLRFNSATSLDFTINNATNAANVAGLSPTNNWIHFVGVYDGSLASGNITVYANGILGATKFNFTTAVAFNANTIFSIGNWFSGSSGTNTSVVGLVDEVALWNTPITANNVQTLYNAGRTAASSLVSPSSLILWYRCGDGDISPTIKNYGSIGSHKIGRAHV